MGILVLLSMGTELYGDELQSSLNRPEINSLSSEITSSLVILYQWKCQRTMGPPALQEFTTLFHVSCIPNS